MPSFVRSKNKCFYYTNKNSIQLNVSKVNVEISKFIMKKKIFKPKVMIKIEGKLKVKEHRRVPLINLKSSF